MVFGCSYVDSSGVSPGRPLEEELPGDGRVERRESGESNNDFDGLLERLILKGRSWCLKRVWI